jgi:hypothetical protein
VPEDDEEGDEAEPRIVVPRELAAGVWANWIRVIYSEHEFTIDFVRLDPFEPRGIVVARISGSPLFVTKLIDMVSAVWHDWARKAMPPEVDGADGE